MSYIFGAILGFVIYRFAQECKKVSFYSCVG